MDLISIIVPVYKVEEFLADCVESILSQDYSDFEVILVDDGSTDSTYSICESIFDERIILFKKENGGASSARNYGLTFAKGKYIYFIDAVCKNSKQYSAQKHTYTTYSYYF